MDDSINTEPVIPPSKFIATCVEAFIERSKYLHCTLYSLCYVRSYVYKLTYYIAILQFTGILGISPRIGSISGGTKVTINGEGDNAVVIQWNL